MRILLPFSICIMLAYAGFAQNNVATKIDAVTVYRQMARISHSGTATLPAGTSELVINDLSASIILPSVQVSLEGSATILSVTARVNYNKPKPNLDKIGVMNDTVKNLSHKLDWINQEKSIYEAEEGVLNEKQKMVGTETGLPVAELEKLVILYRSRVTDIRKKIFKLNEDAQKLNEQKAAVQNRINLINNQTVSPTGEIVVTLLAASAGATKVKCNYMTNNAGWSAIYDLRSDGIEKPVTLNYYAQVQQNTGFNWKDVKIIVSTGNPSLNNSRPILAPLYIDFYSPYIDNYLDKASYTNSALYKSLDDEKNSGPVYTVVVNETQLSAQYDISLPQSIPSDGKTRQVPLKEYELPARYVYHTVPRMDNGAFLLAKVTNWGQYNLLAGMANIFFEEEYIGQSNINPQVTSDTLLLSMGRDEKINVQRTSIIDKESHSFFGGTRKEKRTYEISVLNTKNKPITIEILDQLPVSKQQDIKVELLDKGGAEYTEEIGKLLWTLDLAPGEAKKVRFSFEVSYPKEKTVSPF
ncbi:MAG: DUF4139 domain-containing protein [Chitinophagales bacterium]|nr:DUF4139 domain-containing protein [Chitinophagales bacterium]